MKKLVFLLLVISIVLGTYSVVFASDMISVGLISQDNEGILYYAEDGDYSDSCDFRLDISLIKL